GWPAELYSSLPPLLGPHPVRTPSAGRSGGPAMQSARAPRLLASAFAPLLGPPPTPGATLRPPGRHAVVSLAVLIASPPRLAPRCIRAAADGSRCLIWPAPPPAAWSARRSRPLPGPAGCPGRLGRTVRPPRCPAPR